MIRHVKEFKSHPTEAQRFHEMASAFLSGLGLDLINDPGLVRGRYRSTAAVYGSKRALFLSVSFEPGDSNTAAIFCGRQWLSDQRRLFLSNYYATLAKRLGMEVPTIYTLGYGEEVPITMEKILTDLKQTLPTVIEQVRLEDLISIEQEKFGAAQKAQMRFGPDYLECVEISRFA